MIGLLSQAGEMRLEPGICGSSVWVRVILSPRWGSSVSCFPHGLRRGLHSCAALRLLCGTLGTRHRRANGPARDLRR
jgi:hypothetical protein